MTIQEAREILGPEIEDLSDEQVLDLIKDSSRFCDGLLEVFESDLTFSLKSNHNGVGQ